MAKIRPLLTKGTWEKRGNHHVYERDVIKKIARLRKALGLKGGDIPTKEQIRDRSMDIRKKKGHHPSLTDDHR